MTSKAQSLADKIEAAEGASRELFQAAFEVILPAQDSKQWLEVASRFVGFLRAEAWLSAAEMLVPEDAFWRLGHDGEGQDPSAFRADVLQTPGAGHHKATAATPALALCAASLRARAGEGV